MEQLFGNAQRSDRTPAKETEDTFAFLDRAAGPYWQRVRDNMENWFASYPVGDRQDLARRLRSSRGTEHRGAWWELYLHALFTALGADVSVISDGLQRRPDFSVSLDSTQLLVEATTITGGFPETAGRRRLIDLINEVPPPRDVGLMLRVVADGSDSDHPRKSEIQGPIRSWLEELGDPTAWPMGDKPRLQIDARAWILEFTALHMPDRDLEADGRLIVAGPAIVGYVNEQRLLKTAVSTKATRYGRPDVPLIVAVLVDSAFADPEVVTQALYGSEVVRVPVAPTQTVQLERDRDGVYMHTTGSRNTRLSGVLVSNGARPWYFGPRLPDWWPNPWAEHCLDLQSHFPTWVGTEEGVVNPPALDSQVDPRAVFGLAPDWPGPDKPFRSLTTV
jgi:hypothetical protein